jgi:hypothetical protein
MPKPVLHTIAPGVHTIEAKQRYMGLEMGARMTVLELEGGLLLHSPLALPPDSIELSGSPRWLLAPNLLHHLYAGFWMDRDVQGWAAPGLQDKRQDLRFQGTIDSSSHPFGDEIEVLPMACFPMTNEVALLHKPSRTLIVTDLVFHIPPTAPLLTRVAMRCLCGYPGCQTTLLERIGFRRQQARRELQAILEWDFDRLVMSHGSVIETGGKEALRQAMHWLWKGKAIKGS